MAVRSATLGGIGVISLALVAVSSAHPDTEPMFTKIAGDGSELPEEATLGPGAADWACLKDLRTGLVWEVKTADKGLRDQRWTYTPYDGNPATNGGYPGYKDTTSGDCRRDLLAGGSCNTEAYVRAVSASGLCGFYDWRLPTVRELVAVSPQTSDTSAEATSHLLPNMESGWYWTGAAQPAVTNFSRVVLLPPGGGPTFYDGSYFVLAVHGERYE